MAEELNIEGNIYDFMESYLKFKNKPFFKKKEICKSI